MRHGPLTLRQARVIKCQHKMRRKLLNVFLAVILTRGATAGTLPNKPPRPDPPHDHRGIYAPRSLTRCALVAGDLGIHRLELNLKDQMPRMLDAGGPVSSGGRVAHES